MPVRCVLFDLDGTLLPMAFDDFFGAYFKRIGEWCKAIIEPQALIDAIWKGSKKVMESEDPLTLNSEVFFAEFERITGLSQDVYYPLLNRFYETDFNFLGNDVKPEPIVADTINMLKERNISAVVATNPLFPQSAINHRIAWAGLDPNDFALIAHYENMRFAKPTLRYYRDILNITGFSAEECIMVGNDVGEDLVAEKLGMKIFWLSTHGICDGEAPTHCPQGGYREMYDYLDEMTKSESPK